MTAEDTANTPRRVDQHMAQAANKILGTSVSAEVRSRMRQLPSRLRGGGLVATYAFLLSKSDSHEVGQAYAKLTEGIPKHIVERGLISGGLTRENFLERISNLSIPEYARITAEIDLLAVWLSRLASAIHQAQAPRGKGSSVEASSE